MQLIKHLGAFTSSTRDIINQNFAMAGFGTVGQILYLDPANGNDSSAVPNDQTLPYKTLLAAYGAANAGKNDTIVLISDGATTSTARVDAAFTWAKNATHLIGLCAPSYFSQRARIAPTASTTAFAAFFTVTAAGCLFNNVQFWHGFTTGTTSMICMAISGSRNVFINCHIAGMGDNASAQSAGSRSLKITNDENYFYHCVIGNDTVTRTTTNASLELDKNATSGLGAARNVFEDCDFPCYASASTPVFVKTSAGSLDRWTKFKDCIFATPGSLSGGVTVAAVATMAAAGGGGLLMHYCARYGITDWGSDAPSKAQIFVMGAGSVATNTNTCGLGAVAT